MMRKRGCCDVPVSLIASTFSITVMTHRTTKKLESALLALFIILMKILPAAAQNCPNLAGFPMTIVCLPASASYQCVDDTIGTGPDAVHFQNCSNIPGGAGCQPYYALVTYVVHSCTPYCIPLPKNYPNRYTVGQGGCIEPNPQTGQCTCPSGTEGHYRIPG